MQTSQAKPNPVLNVLRVFIESRIFPGKSDTASKTSVLQDAEASIPKRLSLLVSASSYEPEATFLTQKDSLVQFLRDQMKVERRIVTSLNKSLHDIGNPAVKAVLKGISLDSVKHEQMYDSAATLMTTVSKALSQENLDQQKQLIENHIKIEAELIGKINRKLPTVKDKKVQLLLKAILADEKRHHKLLKQVLEVLVKGETITEADWWDMLWKDVPFHGAPGG